MAATKQNKITEEIMALALFLFLVRKRVGVTRRHAFTNHMILHAVTPVGSVCSVDLWWRHSANPARMQLRRYLSICLATSVDCWWGHGESR